MNVELEQTAAGVLLPVQAQPRARRNAITGEHNGFLKVSVTQAPEKGKANEALAQLIARSLGLKKMQVQIVSGLTASKKKFLITDETIERLQERITHCLSGN